MKKKKTDDISLVCGRVPRLPDSVATLCSSCGQDAYGTRGSVLRAQLHRIPIICEECFDKLEDPLIAGVMHHGRMLSEAEAQAFVEGWFTKELEKYGRN